MANAHPSVVGSQVGNGDATQVSANSRTHQHVSVACRVEADLADWVKEGGSGVFVFLLVIFGLGESSDENGGSVPDNLEDLSGRDFGDIDLKIGIPIVPGPAVEPSDGGDCIEPAKVGEGGIEEGTEHIDLSSPDVGLVFIVNSVLVEPVIDVGLEIDVVSEVARPGGADEEAVLVGDGVVIV